MVEPARVLGGGRYVLLREVGRGAMGVVWLARDELLHREVAVKQLLVPAGVDEVAAGEARARAMREARIAARLHHPNAISVFDVVSEDGHDGHHVVARSAMTGRADRFLVTGGCLPNADGPGGTGGAEQRRRR